MTSNRERNSVDLCKKAAKMTAKVCWRRKTKKPDEGATKAPLEFHTAAAYHLIKKSETEDDVFLVGYALDTVELDLTKAYLLAHFARSARDAAVKNAAVNDKNKNKNGGAKGEAKELAEPRLRSNGDGAGAKYSEKSSGGDGLPLFPFSKLINIHTLFTPLSPHPSATHSLWMCLVSSHPPSNPLSLHCPGAWEDDGDWEDDHAFTARTDVSDISSASGNYRWALFTPTVPMVRRKATLQHPHDASILN